MNLSESMFESITGISRSDFFEYSQEYDGFLKKQRGQPCKFTALEQMLIFLLFLRFHLPDVLVAVLFVASPQVIYATKLRTLDWVYGRLRHTIQIGSADWRIANSITIFGQLFSFVVDGSEQPCESSSNPLVDTRFFSPKKKKHTINKVILINIVTRRIIWISDSYPGSINDAEIMRREHGWRDNLEKHEYGLGDSGFDGLQQEDIPIWYQQLCIKGNVQNVQSPPN